jgi:hypothetical protein
MFEKKKKKKNTDDKASYGSLLEGRLSIVDLHEHNAYKQKKIVHPD